MLDPSLAKPCHFLRIARSANLEFSLLGLDLLFFCWVGYCIWAHNLVFPWFIESNFYIWKKKKKGKRRALIPVFVYDMVLGAHWTKVNWPMQRGTALGFRML